MFRNGKGQGMRMSRKGWAAIVIAGGLVLAFASRQLLMAHGARYAVSPQAPAATAEASVGKPAPAVPSSARGTPVFEPFTPAEADHFLAKARKAEALTDPLQRCLAYPDPPRSHWNADAINAYCHYRSLPTITFDQVRSLIESGHSAELDRRLGEALQAQLTQPESQGLIDHIYENAFDNGSFDIRPTLDAWKRDSPDSAFAYAASGMAYAAMAADARGGNFIQDTPPDAILAMERLAGEADADLRRAMRLDPRITPIYAVMMDIGRMALGRRYALQAEAAGMRVAPANYYLYSAALTLAEPKWGGSLAELKALSEQGLRHANQNPLMYLSATDARLREFNFYSCRCTTPPEMAQVMDVLAGTPSYAMLSIAGNNADKVQQEQLAAVYYSEAIRFKPLPIYRLTRAFELVDLGYPSWAHAELTAVAPALPGRGDVYRGLAYADLHLEENTRAASELEQAVRLDDTDTWSWVSLGVLYANRQQWDKAWDAADQLIRLEPDNPDGWRLRAQVQVEQPRAGLADTVQAFASRFGKRPDQQAPLQHMREALARARH
jgi:tetratricopeptide (TPR) repeat protein